MTKVRILTASVIGLLILNVVVLTFFLLKKPGPGHRPHGPKDYIIEKLSFTDQQQAAYLKLIETHREEVQNQDAVIMAQKQQLYGLLSGSDTSGAFQLEQSIGMHQTEMERIHFNHFQAIKELCNPEQIPKFQELSMELAGLFSQRKPAKRDK